MFAVNVYGIRLLAGVVDVLIALLDLVTSRVHATLLQPGHIGLADTADFCKFFLAYSQIFPHFSELFYGWQHYWVGYCYVLLILSSIKF